MPSSPSPSLSRKLLFYGLGAGAATAATSAHAVVNSNTGLTAQGNTLYLDLANNAYGTTLTTTDEFEFSLNTTSPASAYGLKVNSGNFGEIVGFSATPTGETTSTNYISKLAAGTVIGSSSGIVTSASKPLFDTATATNAVWQPGSTGYVGLEFSSASSVEYGWAQLTLNNLTGNNGGAFTPGGVCRGDKRRGHRRRFDGVARPGTEHRRAAGCRGRGRGRVACPPP